ncbi:hypothetical protein A4X06_0g7128 [Tilletia controversa]|uniref:Uncharacterized protein n=1 Tax=Tilletia controversa TaxID=13291 RepID=A0A8X7MNQ9_9BASI|nr:hypothetical protein A4X06_0g7128 [Tilletia controversa]
MSLAKKKEWVRSTAHQGLDHGICHVLSSMSILRRRKFTQPIPPESDLPLHQTLAMQLLARLGSIRQGHQQIQGRNNRGERGTAMIKNINKNLTKARTAAYELLPKLNEAVRVRSRSRLEPFTPLRKDELFSDAAYRWVARETQQYSAWWSNPVVSAALEAFEELARLEEEVGRVRLEIKSALLWLKAEIQNAFSTSSPSSLTSRLDLMRIYLAWYPPHARKKLALPSAQDKFPWGLPAGAQEIVCDSIKVAPSNMEGDVKDDPRLVQEAVDLLHAGVLTSSDIPTIFFDPSSPSVWIPILPPPTHAAQRRTPEQYPLTPSTSILRQSPPRLPLHVILKDNRHCPHLRRCGLAKLVRRTERGIAYVITLAPDSDLSLETIASSEATTALLHDRMT